MLFWASSEVFAPASESSEEVRRLSEPWINRQVSDGDLKTLELKLRYVPIIMPVDMHDKYMQRSRSKLKERIYECAPQLDYRIFVYGTLGQQLSEYFSGIALAVPHLARFGATTRHVAEFERIIADGPRALTRRKT